MTHLFKFSLRKSFLSGLMLAGALGSAVHALAQTQSMQVTVPFAFQSGSTKMPAGTYRVQSLSNHTVAIQAKVSKVSAFVMTTPQQRIEPLSKGKVIFLHYGNTYILSQVWQAGDPIGGEVRYSRAERDEVAKAAAAPSNVEIAANAR